MREHHNLSLTQENYDTFPCWGVQGFSPIALFSILDHWYRYHRPDKGPYGTRPLRNECLHVTQVNFDGECVTGI